MQSVVISLCDFTGAMVAPWVAAGYSAVLVDPQHAAGIHQAGRMTRIGHVVDDAATWRHLREVIATGQVAAVFGFPVCTELAASGAGHWPRKRADDPYVQARAMQLVNECRVIGEMSGAPWFIENPISAISSIYRKPDHLFNPFEYGGYLPANEPHPLYPDYFPPQDAYGKTTCLWAGGGFVMPAKRPVTILAGQDDGQGQSRAHNKLGGKSDRTKNIRSATPRGFAQAVYLANAPHLKSIRALVDNNKNND